MVTRPNPQPCEWRELYSNNGLIIKTSCIELSVKSDYANLQLLKSILGLFSDVCHRTVETIEKLNYELILFQSPDWLGYNVEGHLGKEGTTNICGITVLEIV